jgi:hypothetical protein
MAVFKDENGVWKPSGYPNGWINPRNTQGMFDPAGGTSTYPQLHRVCARRFDFINSNEGKMRAASVSLNGSVRKGGDCEKNLTE